MFWRTLGGGTALRKCKATEKLENARPPCHLNHCQPRKTVMTHAPFPLHVVIDGDGVIRHLSVEADPDAIAAVLEGLLDEG